MTNIHNWVRREDNDLYVDVRLLYGNDNKQHFTVEIHHSGIFTNTLGREYRNGKKVVVDFVDIQSFNIQYLEDMIQGVGYKGIILCTTCKLDESLDYGIMPLYTNKDARQFVKTIKEEGFHITRSIYVEYLPPYINVFYPQIFLHTPNEFLANRLYVVIEQDPNASVFKARRFFMNKYELEFDFIRLNRILKAAQDKYMLWVVD